eukprot:g31345.t1
MRGCWTGLAELGCLRGILMDSHLPKRVSMLPAILIHKARSQTYRFADGVQSFFGTGRISHGISYPHGSPGEPLGKGSFGEVRVAMDKHTRERNAVKCAFVSKRDKMSQKENQKEKDYIQHQSLGSWTTRTSSSCCMCMPTRDHVTLSWSFAVAASSMIAGMIEVSLPRMKQS